MTTTEEVTTEAPAKRKYVRKSKSATTTTEAPAKRKYTRRTGVAKSAKTRQTSAALLREVRAVTNHAKKLKNKAALLLKKEVLADWKAELKDAAKVLKAAEKRYSVAVEYAELSSASYEAALAASAEE
jgi:hypothetical protein